MSNDQNGHRIAERGADDGMVAPDSSAPARGERRAVVGYRAQYLVAASLILRGLRERTLEWVRVADPEAGRVDDLQIGSQLRVDAFQIKWSQYGGSFTFNDLTARSRDKPSLIAQLADGWSRLRTVYTGMRVVVHLVTNETPSVSDGQGIPAGEAGPVPKHFAAFVEQVWKPVRDTPSEAERSVPEPWRPAWDALREAAGLSDVDFEAFVADCELELGWSLPTTSGRTATVDEQTALGDVKHLAWTLFATVADPTQIVQLTRNQLLARLDWKARFEFKSRHEFPVDEALYEPIEASVRALQEALDRLPGGYIAVLGTPGSGKSTLLTVTLRARPERVVKYYAYVPDAHDPIRGESVGFLHDTVLRLEQAGFRVGESPSSFDRGQLLDRLSKQLERLHEDWQATSRRTIILVDGLDYVARKLRPERSLLADLPWPVPDGVFFVLGSQTDQLNELPSQIQHAIRQAERRIQMQLLTREAVRRITERAGLPVPPAEPQKERIWELSAGHPLVLAYLLNLLRGTMDEAALEAVLDRAEPFKGDIEAYYHSLWRHIESDAELAHLLALSARLRGAIDLSWVETWCAHDAVDRLRHSLWHYFRTEGDKRWHFFHNSFRLFVIERTAESQPGVFDPSRDAQFHRELAEKCAAAPAGSRWSWESLHHLHAAGEQQTVLERVSQKWFRSQFLAFRAIEAIRHDIGVALKSAATCQDPVAVARLALAGAEIAQRGFYVEKASLIELLLGLGDYDIAVECLREGNDLRVTDQEALNLVPKLKAAGLTEEARRVFQLAEPLGLLNAASPIPGAPEEKTESLLYAWAGAAPHFLSTEEVVYRTRAVNREADRFGHMDAKAATQALQNQMLLQAGLSLLREQRWTDIATLASAFDPADAGDRGYWLWLQFRVWKDHETSGDLAMARSVLEEVVQTVGEAGLSPEERVTLAEGVYRVLGDEGHARALLKDVSQPQVMSGVLRPDSGLAPFLHRYRLNRMLRALGDTRGPEDVVPDVTDETEQGNVLFERGICAIAHIWADAWRGQQLSGSDASARAASLLALFRTQLAGVQSWRYWYASGPLQAEFYCLLSRAVARHGPEPRAALRVAFEQEWDDQRTCAFWPTSVQRQITLTLFDEGSPPDWAARRLREIEQRMLKGQDLGGAVEECRAQAEAWLHIGNKEAARRVLSQMLQVSFGVGYRKDYQLDAWIEWLDRINGVEPERAGERIAWLARACCALAETTERASGYAALELLAVTFRWSPRRAVSLFQWLLENKAVWHQDAARVLLREALKSDQPATELVLECLADFAVPLAAEADAELAALLLGTTATTHGNAKAAEAARYLLHAVHVHALPSTRAKWRRGIGRALASMELDLEDFGLDASDLQPDRDEEGSSRVLRLKDGSSPLSLEEVKARIASVSDIETLLQNEADDSYFDWKPVVGNLTRTLSPDQIRELARLFETRRGSACILAGLSERLADLSHIADAWALGEQALAASAPQGWMPEWDGASRIAAFKALVRTDASRARPLAFKTLVRDLTGEFPYPENVALHLDEILPVLTDDVPVKAVWAEVEEYLAALLQALRLAADGPTGLDQPPAQDTASRALADLLVLQLQHPAIAVAQCAQRACTRLLLRGNHFVRQALREALESGEAAQEAVLIVLDAVGLRAPDALVPLRDAIQGLYNSPNYAVRHTARTVGERIGCEPPCPAPTVLQLPAIYRLALPVGPAPDRRQRRPPAPGEPVPDSSDPVEIVRPFNLQLEAIAEATRLPHVNMCFRAVEIMRQLAPWESWSAQAEKDLRERLESVGLEFTFRRPRAVLARRAMFHVVQELVDAGLLDSNQLARLDRALRFYDPAMLLAEPQPRPPDVRPLAGLDDDGGVGEKWLEQAESAAHALCTRTDDGRVVLAEESTLKRLEWASPTEVRRSVAALLRPTVTAREDEDVPFFCEVTNRLFAEYPNIRPHEVPMPLVVRHVAYGYDSPGDNWLALNPVVGRQFGWHPVDEGLFRWVDQEGQVMVESVCWMDGLLDHAPPHFEDEVGEGWLVLTSRDAVDIIKGRLGSLQRTVSVRRFFRRDGREYQRRGQFEEAFDP
jgi:hypothetical protein